MTRAEARSQPGTTARPRPAEAAQAPAAQPDHRHGSTARPRPTAATEMYRGASVEESELPDLALYERLIADGIAAADARDSAVDHVTARRLAIFLAARPQSPALTRSLVHFVRTGAVSHTLKTQLRIHARSATYCRPAPGRQADAILHRPRHRPRPGRGELRRRLRPDRPRRHPARQRPRPHPAPRPGT